MPVDKFGRSSVRPVSGRPGVSLRVVNNNFLRRDGTNTVTGPINMNGNILRNIGDPTEDHHAVTKSYVDSNDASTKLSKTGGVMTGDLLFTVDTTGENRFLGCLHLPRGKVFSLALGNVRNRFEFRNAAVAPQRPVSLETTHGLMVRAKGNAVCRIGSGNNPPAISVYTNIEMNSNKIIQLSDPVYPHEAVSKNYIDRRLLSMSFLSYEGHIPPLERPISKTGFVVATSSRLNALHEAWLAFNSGKNGEWVTAGEGAGAWIQISCPTAVRIWKIRLTGRRANTDRITSWKLSGGTGESDTLTDIHTSNITLGSTMQEFLINAQESYNIYRLTVVSAEPQNTGLSYFQIFIENFYA